MAGGVAGGILHIGGVLGGSLQGVGIGGVDAHRSLLQSLTQSVGIAEGKPGLIAEAAGHGHGKGPVAVALVGVVPAGHGGFLGQQVSAQGVHQNGGGGGGAHSEADVGVADALAIGGSGVVHRALGLHIGKAVLAGQAGRGRQQTQNGVPAAGPGAAQHALQLDGLAHVAVIHGQRIGLHRSHAAAGLVEAGPADKGAPLTPAEPLGPLAVLGLGPAKGFGHRAFRQVGVPTHHHCGKIIHGQHGRDKLALDGLGSQHQSAAADAGGGDQAFAGTRGKIIAAGKDHCVVHKITVIPFL